MNVCWVGVTLLLLLACGWTDRVYAGEYQGDFLPQWAVEIHGGEVQARSVAETHGYTLLHPLKDIPDHYLLTRRDVNSRSRRSADHHTARLTRDTRVKFVSQQQQLERNKRGFYEERLIPLSVRLLEQPMYTDPTEYIEVTEKDERSLARNIALHGGDMNDPEGGKEWYISAAGTQTREEIHTLLGVKEAWKKGYTGKNVTVTILDDGIERLHPDLEKNYCAEASYDFNDRDDDPNPRYDPTNENKHGTRCAGEVAMVANNGICGTGIAFDARIGGCRLLDGKVTDSLEGESLAFARHHIDIYSASWGPNDDGKTTEGPQALAAHGMQLGIDEGRGGKGAIYVWASGNGGGIGDNCNSDGYTSSIYTLSISSASEKGHSPWYSEKCSSTMGTTYSSGSATEGKVTSTDLFGKCTSQHSGTSAAAPMAAGLIALLLEANPDLTWRDVQHIVAHTSRMEPLKTENGWYKNGVGYCVNLAFGFGLMNADEMVTLADRNSWQNVGPQKICKVQGTTQPQPLHSGSQVEVIINTSGCKGQDNEVNYLEHVQVIVDIEYSRRGDLYIEQESPMGTITPLMLERKYDTSKEGFKHWALMSVHNWGEQAAGVWKVRIADKQSQRNNNGTVKNVELVLRGTKEMPEYRKNGVKPCDAPEGKMNVESGDNQQVDPNQVAQDALKQLADGLKNILNKQTRKASRRTSNDFWNNAIEENNF